MEKIWGPNSGFAVAKKLQVLEKKFSKWHSSSLFVQIWSSNGGQKFFKINVCRDIYVSVILRFRKVVLHNKIINKTWSTKNQKNSAHRFGVNYHANHLVKFLQDRIKPWRVGTLVIIFLKLIISEGFLTSFDFWRGSC